MQVFNMFSPTVCAQLKYYVYRLIDPRNGETFYVGKGKGNRVFMHVKDELGSNADVLSEKLQRIREIRAGGFEVLHCSLTQRVLSGKTDFSATNEDLEERDAYFLASGHYSRNPS
jgi:hypothetical protein